MLIDFIIFIFYSHKLNNLQDIWMLGNKKILRYKERASFQYSIAYKNMESKDLVILIEEVQSSKLMDANSSTFLDEAIIRGSVEMIRALIARDDFDIKFTHLNPLHAAIQYGHPNIFIELFKYITATSHITEILETIEDLNVLNRYIQKDAKVANAPEKVSAACNIEAFLKTEESVCRLNVVTNNGFSNTYISELLDLIDSVNTTYIRDCYGNSILEEAADRGSIDMVKAFEARKNSFIDTEYFRSLQIAINHGYSKIFELIFYNVRAEVDNFDWMAKLSEILFKQNLLKIESITHQEYNVSLEGNIKIEDFLLRQGSLDFMGKGANSAGDHF